jgi:hypothetical protein
VYEVRRALPVGDEGKPGDKGGEFEYDCKSEQLENDEWHGTAINMPDSDSGRAYPLDIEEGEPDRRG